MASVRLPALPSCVPSLHDHYSLLRYYGRSDPGRPFRHHPPWFPDSRHQNFPSFCLQPSAVLDQTRSTASTLAALFCSGFALRSQARQNRRPNRVHSVRPSGRTTLRTDGSLPVALHPGLLPRCSYFQLLALQCRPGQGLSPCCSSALSGARAPTGMSALQAPRFRGTKRERGLGASLPETRQSPPASGCLEHPELARCCYGEGMDMVWRYSLVGAACGSTRTVTKATRACSLRT